MRGGRRRQTLERGTAGGDRRSLGEVGAGSTVTKSVEDEELAVARGKQRNISGWQRPVKKG